MANGDKYEGTYENSIPTGIHKVTYADGTIESAYIEKTGDSSWTWIILDASAFTRPYQIVHNASVFF
jgi:hypothetical protein